MLTVKLLSKPRVIEEFNRRWQILLERMSGHFEKNISIARFGSLKPKRTNHKSLAFSFIGPCAVLHF